MFNFLQEINSFDIGKLTDNIVADSKNNVYD